MDVHHQLSHSETPGTTAYTKAGNEAAGASVLAYGRPTGKLAVDGWIGAPFHASCLINAYWSVGGFALKDGWSGEWCHGSMQTFDLASGVNGPIRSSLRRNYTYPSAAMKVPKTVLLNANESPDPVTPSTAPTTSAASGVEASPSSWWTTPTGWRPQPAQRQSPARNEGRPSARQHLSFDRWQLPRSGRGFHLGGSAHPR